MAVSRSSMYKGLSVSLMRTSFQNMILFSLFEYTKSQINSLETWTIWWNEIIKLLNHWIWRGGRLRLRQFHLLLFARNITQISMCNTTLCTYEKPNGSALFIVWTFCTIYFSHTTRSLGRREIDQLGWTWLENIKLEYVNPGMKYTNYHFQCIISCMPLFVVLLVGIR